MTAEGTQETQTTITPDRPEWLPEKFKTGSDLANAYAELESKLGRSAVPTKPEGADGKTELSGTESQVSKETQEEVASNPAFAEFHKEFAEKGELNPESYTKLEALGVSKDMVDQYIAGAKATADATVGQIYQVAGGEESYKSMIEWAGSEKSGLSDAEIAAFDKAVTGNDIATAKLAVEGLRSKFRAAVPTKPVALKGENGKFSGSAQPYTNMAQVTADMRNPLYKTDQSFRDKVAQRLAKSNV